MLQNRATSQTHTQLCTADVCKDQQQKLCKPHLSEEESKYFTGKLFSWEPNQLVPLEVASLWFWDEQFSCLLCWSMDQRWDNKSTGFCQVSIKGPGIPKPEADQNRHQTSLANFKKWELKGTLFYLLSAVILIRIKGLIQQTLRPLPLLQPTNSISVQVRRTKFWSSHSFPFLSPSALKWTVD